MITLLAIALAYSLETIPTRKEVGQVVRDEEPDHGLLNELDKNLLRRWGPFRALIENRGQQEKHKQYEAIQRFVLTLSDQQIVTGLAIFIIGYSRHCTIFTYHFFIIVALGWFSATTHLSTLTILNDYFKNAPTLRYTRLLGMLLTFIMLFVGLLVLYTRLDFRVRVQCRFHRIFIPHALPLQTICMVLVFVYIVTLTLSKSVFGILFRPSRTIFFCTKINILCCVSKRISIIPTERLLRAKAQRRLGVAVLIDAPLCQCILPHLQFGILGVP